MRCRKLVAGLLLSLTWLLAADQAEASHFRGGDVWATIDANGVVRVFAQTRWRKGSQPFPFGGIDPFFGGTGLGYNGDANNFAYMRIFRVNANGTLTLVVDWTTFKNNSTAGTTADTYLNNTTVSTNLSDSTFNERLQVLIIPFGTFDPLQPPAGQGRKVVNPLNLASGSVYTIEWADCARVAGIRNHSFALSSGTCAPNQHYGLRTAVRWDGTVNGSPRFDSSVIVGVGRGFEYAQNLNAVDPDGESLAFAFSPLVAGSPVYGPTSRIPGITLDQFGNVRIPPANTSTLVDNTSTTSPGADYMEKFIVSDSSGAFSERDIMIDAVNRFPPTLDAIGNRTVEAGTPVSVTVTGRKDASGASSVFLRASGLPPGATLTGGGVTTAGTVTGTFTWTPAAAQEGTHAMNFEVVASYASPPQLADSEFVQITVVSTNHPPVLEEIANLHVGADPLNVQAFVAETKVFDAVASDPNAGDVLTYSLPVLIDPNGNSVPLSELDASIVNAIDALGRNVGRVALNPGFEDVGVWQLRVRVDDGEGGSDEQNVFISVGTFANQSPVFTASPPATVAVFEGVTLSIPVTATDPDAGQLVSLFSAGAPPGASFPQGTTGNPVSASFEWTPGPGTAGDYTVFFDARDNASGGAEITERVGTIINVLPPCDGSGGPAPRILRLAPNRGPAGGGTLVELLGGTFCDPGEIEVTVGGVAASSVALVDAMTLTFRTPAGTENVAADVTVTTPGGFATLSGGFLYLELDTIAPELTVPADLTVGTNDACTYVDGIGTATATDDVSSGAGLVITNDAPAAFPLGTTTVTWTATDEAGNSTSATQLVTVVDDDAPSLTPPAALTVGTNSGATYVGEIGSATASDNCSVGAALAIANDAPAAFPLGTTTVTWTATDAAGNVTSATQLVTVVDDDPPSITAPAALTVGTNDACTYVGGIGTATATDNVSSGAGLVISNNAPAAFPLGTTTVTWTATDEAGNSTSATQQVTVVDDDAPSLTPPAALTVGTNSGATYVGEIGSATASDNCSVGAALAIANDAPAAFPLGTTTVTWTATDAAGNSATATQVVTVVDDDPPSLTPPAALTVGTNSGCTYVGAIGTATATDDVSSGVGLVITNDAPVAFPLGDTVVTWMATDEAGNSTTATQVVTVVDDDPPSLTPPAALMVGTNSGATYVGEIGSATASDNCSAGAALLITNNAPAAFPVGTTTVTWTATDAAGNVTSATQLVTVVDDDPPSITAPAALTVGTNDACTYVGGIGTATATDNVSSGAGLVITNNAPAAFPLGDTMVTWTATDEAGNSATATQVVTVVDDDAPLLTAPAALTVGTNSGATYVGPIGSATASDNCSAGAALAITNDAPGVFPLGLTTVTWTATDAAGNSTTVTQVVTVVDDDPPVIFCPAPLERTSTDPSGLFVSYAAEAVDNVPGPTVIVKLAANRPFGSETVTPLAGILPTGGTFPEGHNDVTLAAVDAAGNESAPCVFTIRILPDHDDDGVVDFRAALHDVNGNGRHDGSRDADGNAQEPEPGDNCNEGYNPDQQDFDGDGIGDPCDGAIGIWDPTNATVDPSAGSTVIVGGQAITLTTPDGGATAMLPEGAVLTDSTLTIVRGQGDFQVVGSRGAGHASRLQVIASYEFRIGGSDTFAFPEGTFATVKFVIAADRTSRTAFHNNTLAISGFEDTNGDGIEDTWVQIPNCETGQTTPDGRCTTVSAVDVNGDGLADAYELSASVPHFSLYAATAWNSPPIARAVPLVRRIADASCTVTIAASDADGGSFDPNVFDAVLNPDPANPSQGTSLTLSLSQTVFTGLGDHPVVLTATDEESLSDSASTVVRVVAPTVVDFSPKTINKKAKGQYVTVYLEFANSSCGRGPADVDVSSVTLQAIDPVTSIKLHVAPGSPTSVGDGNNNGVVDRMVKFDRAVVQSWFPSDSGVVFRVEGRFLDGTSFEGDDSSVRVIDAGVEHTNESSHGSVKNP